jgi:hypothetical protein
MKKSLLVFVFSLLIFPSLSYAQVERPDIIKGGFYLKLGVVFPMGKYAQSQHLDITNPIIIPHDYKLDYLPAKIGGAMDMGYLIYLGPSFANKFLRAGIDATFLSFWYDPSSPIDNKNKYEHYYYFVGQKFGPMITVNPIDRLMIDVSYKLNFNFGYHYDEWESLADAQYSKFGKELLYQELGLSLRYRIMMFSFLYNFGKMTYDNLDDKRPDQKIQTNTFRIMFGLKF